MDFFLSSSAILYARQPRILSTSSISESDLHSFNAFFAHAEMQGILKSCKAHKSHFTAFPFTAEIAPLVQAATQAPQPLHTLGSTANIPLETSYIAFLLHASMHSAFPGAQCLHFSSAIPSNLCPQTAIHFLQELHASETTSSKLGPPYIYDNCRIYKSARINKPFVCAIAEQEKSKSRSK